MDALPRSASNQNISNKRFTKSAGFVYLSCRFTTYRHRFARAAPAPRRIVDVHRPSIFELRMGPLESRNDSAMVFFRKDFHPRLKLHPQISL